MGSDVSTDGTFPRTVKHFKGSTALKAAPTRIAVLSTGQLDDLLSLGIVPTVTTRATNAGSAIGDQSCPQILVTDTRLAPPGRRGLFAAPLQEFDVHLIE